MPAGGKCSVYVKEKEGISVTAEQEIQQLECAVLGVHFPNKCYLWCHGNAWKRDFACLGWICSVKTESWITQKPLECVWASPYVQCITGLTCGQGKRRGLTSWACAAGFSLVWGCSAFHIFPKCKLSHKQFYSRSVLIPGFVIWWLRCENRSWKVLERLLKLFPHLRRLFWSALEPWGENSSTHTTEPHPTKCSPALGKRVRSEVLRSVSWSRTLLQSSSLAVLISLGTLFKSDFALLWPKKVPALRAGAQGLPDSQEPGLVLGWVFGSSHNVQHRLHKSELWDTCVLRLESVQWYQLCLHFLVALKEWGHKMIKLLLGSMVTWQFLYFIPDTEFDFYLCKQK